MDHIASNMDVAANPASHMSTEDPHNLRLKVCTRQTTFWLMVKHDHSPPVWAWVMVLNNGQKILCHSEVDLCPFGSNLSSPFHSILSDACGNYCCTNIMNCWLMSRKRSQSPGSELRLVNTLKKTSTSSAALSAVNTLTGSVAPPGGHNNPQTAELLFLEWASFTLLACLFKLRFVV